MLSDIDRNIVIYSLEELCAKHKRAINSTSGAVKEAHAAELIKVESLKSRFQSGEKL